MDHEAPTEYAAPAAVRVLPSWLLGQAARRAHDLVAQALAPHAMGRQHYTVLATLAEAGPASQADLGRRLWLDRSDMHTIVTGLEQSGLVARAGDPADLRRKVVRITASGRRTLKQLERSIDAAQEQVLAPLDASEREQLIALLARIGRS